MPVNVQESERLLALHRWDILDTPPESGFDDIAQAAAAACDAPYAFVTFVDRDRVWFKASVGMTATEMQRDGSFCGAAVMNLHALLCVPNTLQDPRFRDSSLVTGDAHIRAYLGAPVIDSSGHAVGTLCVLDDRPRPFSDAQQRVLERLAPQVARNLAIRERAERYRKATEDEAHRYTGFTDFARIVTQDLREPLQAISHLADWLEDSAETGDGPATVEHARLIRGRAQRLDRMLHGLRDYCSLGPESGLEVIDVGRAIEEIVAHCHGAERVDLALSPLPNVRTIPAALDAVLRSLVRNSIAHSTRTPVRVEVRAAVEGDELHLDFLDDGNGIPSGFEDAVFMPFATLRADANDEAEEPGTGLGLTIAREAAAAMGGSLVLPVAESTGAGMRLILPASSVVDGSAPENWP